MKGLLSLAVTLVSMVLGGWGGGVLPKLGVLEILGCMGTQDTTFSCPQVGLSCLLRRMSSQDASTTGF